ncbi:hypothetical protein NKK52_21115 [Mesorhizobium sp. C277A]|uniref:hypothetical protein n=1 Tax=Mesorhizobium sp. C277A TaxID=2956827 RepID=UPI0012EC21AA|nr:hypothetical protein [Mesorhizobium sp. LSJC277A00]
MPAIRLVAIGFFFALCGVAQADPWWLEQPPPAVQERQQSPADAAKEQDPKNEVGETFWERTLYDPVALSTVIIALFTVVLGIGTGFLVVDGRRHSRHALRAYVFVDSAGFFDRGLPENEPQVKDLIGFIGCSIHIKNSGQTPAYNLIHWAQIAICTPEEQDEVLTIPPLDGAVPNTLAPGGFNSKWINRTDQVAPDEIADVIAGRKMLYLYGRVEYNDTFGRRRFTNHRLTFSGGWPPYNRIGLIYSERGNESDQNE